MGARVYLRHGAALDSAPVAQSVVDSNGAWSFPHVASGTWNIEARSLADSLVQVGHATCCAESEATITLQQRLVRGQNLTGTILDSTGAPMQAGTLVTVLGLGRSTTLDANGLFTITNLPVGDYWLAVQPTGAEVGYVFASTNASNVLTVRAGLLLDNFSDGVSQTYYGRWLGNGGYWYIVLDPSGASSVIPSQAQQNMQSLAQVDSATGIPTLHVQFQFTQTAWALVGFEVGVGSAGANWCDLRQISFRAKGSGSFQLELQTSQELALGDSLGHFEYAFTLGNTWQELVVPVDSFKLDPHSIVAHHGGSWASACAQVEFINFISHTNSDLWLSDLRVNGINF